MTPEERTSLIDKLHEVTDKHIYGFFKEFRFLSNFHQCPIFYEGLIYGSTEAAYQAAKSLLYSERVVFANEKMTPSKAKKLGRLCTLRDDWEDVKLQIMYDICLFKFITYSDLNEKLIATGERYLEETNYWGDRFWGADLNHHGSNHLGKTLMEIREYLISNL